MTKSNLAKFDPSNVFAYVESPEIFSVPFDGLWQAVGYSRKDYAVEQLRSELIEGEDFLQETPENSKPTKGRPSIRYRLTADAAKVFAVRARTPEGVGIAKLFVAAYNELKAEYNELKRQQQSIAVWQQARLRGKKTRRQLMDAVQDYVDRHRSELSENAIRWMYINVSDRVNLVVFGRKAKRLAEDLQLDRGQIRNGLDEMELKLIESVEDTAIRLIDQMDMHPDEAIKLAGVNLLIPVQTRGLQLSEGA